MTKSVVVECYGCGESFTEVYDPETEVELAKCEDKYAPICKECEHALRAHERGGVTDADVDQLMKMKAYYDARQARQHNTKQ